MLLVGYYQESSDEVLQHRIMTQGTNPCYRLHLMHTVRFISTVEEPLLLPGFLDPLLPSIHGTLSLRLLCHVLICFGICR